MVTPVDVVTHEEVVRVGRLAANLEQLHQVMKLLIKIMKLTTTIILRIAIIAENNMI